MLLRRHKKNRMVKKEEVKTEVKVDKKKTIKKQNKVGA